MLDSYDMPMLDYPGDLDIQMHPSTSEQWLQEEAQMEEDGTFLPSKTDFEVDMEASAEDQNVEYDMLDDDDIRGSGAEVLDVEVYDVSSAQSPAMVNVDISFEQPPSDLTAFRDARISDGRHESSPPTSNFPPAQTEARALEPSEDATEVQEVVDTATYEASEVVEEVELGQAEPEVTRSERHDFQEFALGGDHPPSSGQSALEYSSTREELVLPRDEYGGPRSEYHSHIDEPISRSDDQVNIRFQEEHSESVVTASHDDQATGALPNTQAIEAHVTEVSVGSEHLPGSGQEQVSSLGHQEQGPEEEYKSEEQAEDEAASAHTSVDPHEISEGVYIDPPPPVLLSLTSEDHFKFYLFNAAEAREGDSTVSTHQILLHQLPTLYYEPLSAVFDALRREESLQGAFHVADSELVLEAIDLQLIISEDNIYAVDVSLHDLNVLHDGSGIGGLLRMRLSATTPRFITRYQYLQEHVNRLHLEQLPGEARVLSTSVAEAPQESREADQPSELETNVRANPGHLADAEAEEPGGQKADTGKNGDTDNESFEVPVSEGISLSSAFGVEQRTEDGPEEGDLTQPSHGSDTQLHDIDPTINASESTEDSSDASEEGGTIEHHADHYDENDTIHHEDTEAARHDENDDEYTESDHADAAEKSAFENTFAQGEEEKNATEASVGATREATHFLESVDVINPSTSSGSPETEGTATLEDTNDINESYDLREEAEHSPNVEAHDDLEDAADFDRFSDDEEPATYAAHDIDNEDRLPPAADPVSGSKEPGDGYWEEDLDGEGEFDTTWDDVHENDLSQSNHSSVTLSSTASKRSFDEFESAADLYDGETGHWNPPSSPDPKRSRTQ